VAAGEVLDEGRMLADNGLAPSLRRQLVYVSQATTRECLPSLRSRTVEDRGIGMVDLFLAHGAGK
jgi:hypothetical protein